MKKFKEIQMEEWKENACKAIGKDWMLVAASKDGKTNAMTASWGGLGVMWGKNAAYIFIRPQRFTKEFIDGSDTLSLTFYDEKYRDTLSYMGRVSGRDEEKIAEAGLNTVVDADSNTPYFKEAKTVLICRKMYAQELQSECFIDQEANEKWYPQKDYHTMYVCEIKKILVRE